MKKLLFLSTLLLESLILNAQSTIFSENFESGTLPAGWTRSQNTPSFGWEFGSALSSLYFVIPPHTNYAVSNDDAHDNVDAIQNKADKDFLITPFIDLTGHAAANLRFDAFYPGNDFGSIATIEITTDNGATWSIIKTLTGHDTWQSVSVSLNNYLTNSNIKIGFKHNDSNLWAAGFAIDNVSIIEPGLNDAEFTSISINHYLLVGNHPVSGCVSNRGSAPLTAIDISWQVNGGIINTQHFSNLYIANSQNFNFTHNVLLNIATAETYLLQAWIANPNGTSDANLMNDTLVSTAIGLTHFPEKKVLIEDVTGAWCGYCPDATVILDQISTIHPRSIGITIHDNDGMSFSEGDTLIAQYITGLPSGMIDRYKFSEVLTIARDRELWQSSVNERLTVVVPVSVSATNTYDQKTRLLTVNASATFYGNFTGTNYRFNCLLIEDSCSGNGTNWDQVNYYNTTFGHPMYGLGNPILSYQHMHVLRAMLGNTWGNTASIPSTIIEGNIYTHTFSYNIPINMKLKDMKFIVIVQNFDMDVNKREILNAEEYSLGNYGFVNSINNESKLNSIFPNPITQNARVTFYLREADQVEMNIYNVIGEQVYFSKQGILEKGEHQLTINGSNLTRGIYFVKLNMGQTSTTKKITIIK